MNNTLQRLSFAIFINNNTLLMPRWLRISLRILAILLGLFAIAWIVIAIYVSRNKDTILKTVAEKLNNKVKGELRIEKMDVVLFSNFPNLSVSLQNVSLQDSLWQQHKHDLLKAESIYADISLTSLISGKPHLHQLRVQHGEFYLYTDSNGYSNTWAMQPKEVKKKKKGNADAENIILTDVNFIIENKTKFKYFVIDIKHAAARIKNDDDELKANIHTEALIKQFCFNTTRGSFLKNKTIEGTLIASYNKVTKILDLPLQGIHIDDDAVKLTGKFNFAEQPAVFNLSFSADKIKLKDATALLTKPIATKIAMVDLEKPLSVKTTLIGKMKFRDTPWVRAYWTVTKSTLHTPVGTVNEANFTGMYTNQVVRGETYGDANSAIYLYKLKGKLFDIPFTFDTAAVTNLKRPVLSGRIRSNIELQKINQITEGNTFDFKSGTANVNLIYKGGLSENDTTIPYIYGYVRLNNAEINYTPRNIAFTNCNGVLNFNGNDLSVPNLQLTRNKTTVQMKGGVKDFLNLFYTSPDKAIIDWHITSNQINISDYLAFVSKAKYNLANSGKKHKTTSRYIARLNRFLELSTAHLDVNLSRLYFRKFNAANVKADILLRKNDISINSIKLNHAEGTLQMKAELLPSGNATPFKMNVDIAHVNVQQLFTAFENFGQEAIEEKNIRGTLSATINMAGSLQSGGGLTPYSLNGNCDFHLVEGALVNFEPLEKVGKIVFRRRNLSNITFKKIANNLQVQGSKVYIKPMAIESSVLNIFLQGVYSLTKGTNIEMEIPIRNPHKDELIEDKELKDKRSRRGIILYLKAEDGEDGKVHIKWNKDGKKIIAE